MLAGREGADLLDGGLGADSMTAGPATTATWSTTSPTSRGSGRAAARTPWSPASTGGSAASSSPSCSDPAPLAGTGNGLDNRLTGNAGANTLAGRGGADHLAGGRGADALIGGAGADVFCFAAPSDSSRRAPDRLQPGGGAAAFEAAGGACGDLIDLSAIDADPLAPGHQDFAFAARHAASSLWLVERAGETVVRASAGSAGELKLVIEDGWTPRLGLLRGRFPRGGIAAITECRPAQISASARAALSVQPISTVGEIGARLPSQGRPRKRVHQGTRAPTPASGPAGPPSAFALTRYSRRTAATHASLSGGSGPAASGDEAARSCEKLSRLTAYSRRRIR